MAQKQFGIQHLYKVKRYAWTHDTLKSNDITWIKTKYRNKTDAKNISRSLLLLGLFGVAHLELVDHLELDHVRLVNVLRTDM